MARYQQPSRTDGEHVQPLFCVSDEDEGDEEQRRAGEGVFIEVIAIGDLQLLACLVPPAMPRSRMGYRVAPAFLCRELTKITSEKQKKETTPVTYFSSSEACAWAPHLGIPCASANQRHRGAAFLLPLKHTARGPRSSEGRVPSAIARPSSCFSRENICFE